MIKFKNGIVKIIFYVVFTLLTLVNLFTIIMDFVQPSSSHGWFASIFGLIFMLLIPSLLMIFFFTNATPHKKRTGKNTRAGKWIPISTSLVLGALAIVLTAIQSIGRCENIGPEGTLWDCDFAGADLSYLDLQESDMKNINLSSANLSGSNLSKAKLNGADMSNSILVDADLSEAVLFNAILDGADLTNTILDSAELSGASLVDVRGLTNESLANLGGWEGMLLQSEDEILAQLWQVCKGIGIEYTTLYNSKQGAASILLITEKGEKHPTTEYVPRSWWPASVSNAELIACIGDPYKVAKQSCTYDDGTIIKRSSQRIDISIFIAQTGELLETITLEGPPPTQCSQKIPAGTTEDKEFLGDAPYGVQIIKALTPFADEGGNLHPPRLP